MAPILSFDGRARDVICRSLGLGLLLAAAITLAKDLSPVTIALGHALHAPFVEGLLVGVSTCAIGSAVLALRRWRLISCSSVRPSCVSVIVGCACVVFGCCAPSLEVLGVTVVTAIVIMSGMVTGVGFALIGERWLGAFYRPRLDEVFLMTALAASVALVLAAIATALPVGLAPVLCAATYTVLSVVLLIAQSVHGHAKDADSIPYVIPIDSFERRYAMKTAALIIWKPMLGMAICAFTLGSIWFPNMTESVPEYIIRLRYWWQLLGPIIFSFLLVAYALREHSHEQVVRFFNISLAVASALMLICPLVTLSFSELQIVLGAITKSCILLFAIVFWCSLCRAAATTSLDSRLLFSSGILVVTIPMLAGMLLWDQTEAILPLLSSIMLTTYLVILIISMVIRSMAMEADAKPARDAMVSYLRSRCEELAKRYGLSARESEVLFLLSRGHNHVFIAEELGVSENTVRTHVRNIYSKMGVASKEDILSMIDSADEEHAEVAQEGKSWSGPS